MMFKFFKRKNKIITLIKSKGNRGFTLIETMISMTIFIIVITVGLNSILNAVSISKKSQDMRSIMDNLSFVFNDMSTMFRSGYNYHCVSNINETSALFDTQDCTGGGGKAFAFIYDNHLADGSIEYDQWVYKIDSSNGTISKYSFVVTDGTQKFSDINNASIPWVQLNADEVKPSSNSSFSVFGANNTDYQQPFVIIKLSGNITYKNTNTPFSLETGLSQRLIDSHI